MHKLKRETAELFGGVCFICNKPFGRSFLYHHLNYRFNERTYRDFEGDTVKYNLYILPIVRKEPDRFLLLCGRHHTVLSRLKKFGKLNLLRLLLAVYLTQ